MPGESFKIGEQVHLLIRSGDDSKPQCAVGWITEWDDKAQTASAMGFRADPEETSAGTFAGDSGLKHDDSAQERPGPDDRLVISFHRPLLCPWLR